MKKKQERPIKWSFYRKFTKGQFRMQASEHLDTAILIFARSSTEDANQKKIPKGNAFFDELTHRTLLTVKKTGLPFYHISEKEQTGATFGERFTNAIEAVFKKGYRSVITLGNDSPLLNKQHILEAYEVVKDGKLAIGPSADGGFYLLGITKAKFETSTFTRFSWQSSRLRREILKFAFAKNTEIHKLPQLSDIDSLKDLKTFLDRFVLLPSSLVELAKRLFPKTPFISFKREVFISKILHSVPHNKGSPLLLSS